MGRFLTRDTWSGDANRPLSFNRWGYVEGNPVNRTDPTGNIVCFPGVLGSVVVDGHFITVQTALELCQMQYSKSWGLKLVPVKNGVHNCDYSGIWTKPRTVADMYIDYLCERGPEHVFFEGTDILTRELAVSTPLAKIRAEFYLLGRIDGRFEFGGIGFLYATLDSLVIKGISLTHYLGTFNYNIQRTAGGRVRFQITNDTDRASGSHFIGRFEPYYWGSLEKLVRLHPTLKGEILDTAIQQHNVISVLDAKTRGETTGDEGGGLMKQTFTWYENDLECLSVPWPVYIPLLNIGN